MPSRLRWMLGALAAGGGAIGIVRTFMQLGPLNGTLDYVGLGLALSLFLSGIFCGTILVLDRAGAARWNLAYWLLQVVSFNSGLLGWDFCGTAIRVMFKVWPATWLVDGTFETGSAFFVSLLRPQESYVGFNLLAMIVAAVLLKYVRAEPGTDAVAGRS